MKIGISLLVAWLALGLLSAPSAVARGSHGSHGGFARSHATFARPHAVVHGRVAHGRVAHGRPVFAGNPFVGNRRVIVVPRRRFAPGIPPRRPFIARHRVLVERSILLTTPAFVSPVFVVIRPVCCG